MAVSPFKTFSAGEVLTASDLNASITQLTNNGTDVAFPLTKNVSAGGFGIASLAAASSDGDAVRFQQLPFSVCDFRLSLTTALPVTVTDVTAATTIYAVPMVGNAIGLYDGTNWHVRTSAEFSLALGTISSGKPYDVFCYDSGGTPTLEFLAWTNDTTRATLLTFQDGVRVKTGALTRRYLGTFYTTSTTTTEDSLANRYLYNYYHRRRRPMRNATETADTWSYTTATIRQANANTANQLNFVVGVNEDAVTAELRASCSNGAAGVGISVGVGLDSTSTFTSGGLFGGLFTPAIGMNTPITASLRVFSGAGRHFLSWNEWSAATNTTTWYGDNASPTLVQSGIHGEVIG